MNNDNIINYNGIVIILGNNNIFLENNCNIAEEIEISN